jgi:hypothetical protein
MVTCYGLPAPATSGPAVLRLRSDRLRCASNAFAVTCRVCHLPHHALTLVFFLIPSSPSSSRPICSIPFAAPPVGALRFRAPQPATPWTAVRDVSGGCAVPTQRSAIGGGRGEMCAATVLRLTGSYSAARRVLIR